jgi:carbamoyltransferase
MNIMGLGGSGHDWSTCLLTGNENLIAIDEERVIRSKYGVGADLLKAESRNYSMKARGINFKQIDHLVACDITPKSFYFPFKNNKTIISHHLAHAYSAYCLSSFDESAIFIADNSGGIVEDNKVETISYYYGDVKGIHAIKKVIGEHSMAENDSNYFNEAGRTNNSLGDFYRMVSIELGFSYTPKRGETISEDGKTMGLSSYGRDTYYKEFSEYIKLLPDGEIYIIADNQLSDYIKTLLFKANSEDLFQIKADIAYAAQKVLEDALIHCGKYLYKITKSPNLCIAGGVGLNSVANARIIEETPFENLFVQPASGDNGTSLGCVLYGYHNIKGASFAKNSRLQANLPYLGIEYKEEEIYTTLSNYKELSWEKWDEYSEIARLIKEGYIIGWFQGKSEFGPRALGNRSILADPRSSEMKDKLNLKVKHRESFRPFAPAVLDEYRSEYFHLNHSCPYMLEVHQVKKPNDIPAVTHVDNTARIQTVSSTKNQKFYNLISAFYELTDVPVLLNTSFNIAGQPIVETPDDALDCFVNTEIDYLVIGDYLVSKNSD